MTTRATVCLSDLCDLIAEPVRPGARPDALYLGLEHLAPGRLVRIGGGKASEMRSNTSAFQPGDVLYGKLRPYLDKAVLADEPGVSTTELLVLRAKAGVDPRFLAAAVHSPSFLEYAIAGTTGVQHPRTSWAHTRDFQMPAFTLCEQQGIADLLWLVHEAISRSEALVEEAQALKRAAMHTLFTRGLRGEAQKETEIGPVSESWERLPVSALGRIVTGNTPPTKDPANYVAGKVPFVAPGDIEHGFRILSAEKFITEQGLENSRPIESGATCFVCIGSTIGKVGYVPFEVCATNQQINAILPSEGFIPQFTFYLMVYWAEHIRKQASPSPVPILSKSVFEQIEVVTTTDKGEQRKIVAVLDAIDRKMDMHRRKRAVLDDLFKTLLHELMTGEIRVGKLELAALSDGIDSGMITPQRIGEQG